MTNGQELVAFYVDECIEQGHPEMERMKGHVARRAKELLDDNVPMDEVKEALHEFVRRQCKSPMQLAELSVELIRDKSEVASERPALRRYAKRWIDDHGWPTGARFVRGSHAGTYKHDVLGHDPLPMGYEGWPYSRPTFDEIVEALSKLSQDFGQDLRSGNRDIFES